MQITKLKEHIGAEVTGIDLRQPLNPAARDALHAAIVEHIALVIRDQRFEPADFLAAASRFGKPMVQQHQRFAIDGNPLLNEVCNQHKDQHGKRLNRGESWHTDHPNHRIPPKFTTLYCVAIPDRGGNTEVVNMRAGYESLPADIKDRIRHLKTANVFEGSATRHKTAHAGLVQSERKPDPVVQPLVRTNPDNGTQALYFSRTKCENIVGMAPQPSQDLLEDLVARALKPEFIYSHKWRPGDMLIWDNRSAMHQGVLDCPEDQLRRFYRVLIEGELPH